MAETPHPAVGDAVLQALANAAVTSTGAVQGWVLLKVDENLVVTAASGLGASGLLGKSVPAGEGSAGYVVSSGQPLAISFREDDVRASAGVASLTGRRPTNVLAVPCTDGQRLMGVLELFDQTDGSHFSFDDIEIASVLADVAGAALASEATQAQAPRPEELAGRLGDLAVTNPARYSRVANLVGMLLASE